MFCQLNEIFWISVYKKYTIKSNLTTLFIFSVDIDNKYIDVLTAVEEAKNEALKGGNCAKYNW